MAKVYDTISDELKQFIERQHLFFVATAPLASEGHVNVSPKGLDSLRILDERTVAYADHTGSGIETVAHVKENRRIVLMFCAFEGAPKILRLHGRGEVLEPHSEGFRSLRDQFSEFTGLRSIIRVQCTRIGDSCGWGVPLYEFKERRKQLTNWADKQGKERVAEYIRETNALSLDGLPGISASREEGA